MIWQTENWKKLLEISNQVEKNIQFGDFSIEKRSLWLNQYGLFILWFKWELSLIQSVALRNICEQEKALFIQIETNSYNEEIIKLSWFTEWYYKKFITPFTAVIDLSKDIESILANMKPKGRYNIKLSNKKWVDCQIVTKSDDNIQNFFNLMHETTSRDNFSWNTLEYYKNFLNIISDSELILAYKDGVAIAWWIFVFWSEQAIYYYWASTSKKEYRNLMAPYWVQFLAIQEAKKRWSTIYDFLWIAGPNEKNSELSWVTDFKLKLTKESRAVSQSFIWINNRFKYTMLVLIRKIKKILKK
jgi:lipid II:glycine glycyltransferase (peptidoglycan interpeptide bridge formation enzyme)